MMYQPSSSGRMRLRALVLVPALALAFGLVNTPAFASVLSATAAASISERKNQAPSGSSINDVRVIAVGDDEATAPKEGDIIPQYPGGQQAMIRFLAENIRYPESMIKGDISGRVLVSFTVEVDGALSDIKVEKGLCPEADSEAERVVASMPRWIPGSSDGKPVACRFSLPISFMLVGGEKDEAVRVVAHKQADETAEPRAYKLESGEHAPAIFIGGERYTGDLNAISPDEIEAITVRKDVPEYPNGRIEISLKKK